ncbi:related to NOC3 protein, required for maturation and intranuclear transport of pre-ribosomes [Claviceps purpurea 20.1]|uniref:Nucleolar complex-associated protein 3 n=1 Tax=Claviceps purpurea (strain 20.1) TaxID=1111077 RepID=M1WDI7_CLAP2|nr:related to NOC3 protein, required for maturation and intranuclear transport of pre-ribosomes [Claviceps purpurea 20.1]
MGVNGVKKRKLAHASSADSQPAPSSKRTQKDFFKQAANWNLEQDYENRPRKGKKAAKESSRLPLKTADGRLELLKGLDPEEDAASIASDTEWLEGRDDAAGSDLDYDQEDEDEGEREPQIPESQKILEAQEELAKAAMLLNENPEENISGLKTMAKIGESKITTIRMLALMTQMAVYKDIIPGYRIRPQSEEDAAREKLSKEVRGLRQFEQALVAGYQAYIKELAQCARSQTSPVRGGQSLSNVAVTCACTLLTSVPHFNFRTELLRIVVGKLSRKVLNQDGAKAIEALETLFRDDEEGRPSLEAVSLVTKMMRAKEFAVSENVLNLFLSLRLLSEFSGKASQHHVEQTAPTTVKKHKRVFRTKKERKSVKEQKGLQKDMDLADALVSHEERERMQSETLKLVFATYFRILKQRSPHLMGAVLEGLAKYAHLINQDFFGDLLEALKDLIRHSDDDAENGSAEDDDENTAQPANQNDDDDDDDEASIRNLTREALLCTVTAYALLAGQDAHKSRNDLHLDLSYFTTHLFRSLLPLSVQPDLENTRLKSHASSSTSTTSKINVQTTTVLLLRSLTGILLPHYNIRQVAPLRLAAFTKQLMTASLQLPEKSAQAVLALLNDIAHAHGKRINSLWNTEERKGNGRFNALSESVEGSNPFATTVWEGELLRKHYSPKSTLPEQEECALPT